MDRDTTLQRVEKQLMPYYYEINVLERRVAEASLDRKARCEQPVQRLYNRYISVENQLQALGKEEGEIPEEDLHEVERNLEKLRDQFEEVGQWIWIETMD
jgi:hypothetical protein